MIYMIVSGVLDVSCHPQSSEPHTRSLCTEDTYSLVTGVVIQGIEP